MRLNHNWPVDDQSTAELMRYFYEACQNGDTPMSALRASMIKSAKSGKHPYL